MIDPSVSVELHVLDADVIRMLRITAFFENESDARRLAEVHARDEF